MKDLVTLEVAKKLKEVGFNKPVSHFYHPQYGMYESMVANDDYNRNTWAKGYYSAPSLSAVANWLRNEKGIHLTIDPTLDWSRWYITIHSKTDKGWSKIGSADTHTLALTAAITHALNLLTDKK